MIELYSMDFCPFCEKAKKLLQDNKLLYICYTLNKDFTKENIAIRLGVEVTSKITLPQIFLDNHNIGGYTELKSCLDAVKMSRYMNGRRSEYDDS